VRKPNQVCGWPFSFYTFPFLLRIKNLIRSENAVAGHLAFSKT
jgi:hypothetical protein